MEGREQRVARDDDSKMIILLVQPPKNVEDVIAVEDGATEVS
jgi:hypothetical protein